GRTAVAGIRPGAIGGMGHREAMHGYERREVQIQAKLTKPGHRAPLIAVQIVEMARKAKCRPTRVPQGAGDLADQVDLKRTSSRLLVRHAVWRSDGFAPRHASTGHIVCNALALARNRSEFFPKEHGHVAING